MSASAPQTRRLMATDVRARKGASPVVMLTAYTTPMARIADRHCDAILVGDSLGMVIHGLPSTIGVTPEMMILHGRAVVRGASRALVVVDLPFGSFEESPQQAFRTAQRIIGETGAGAVKLEGGQHMAETIAFLAARGVPVMAHVGLTPQAVNTLGGYKLQGRADDAARVRDDARAVAAAGAFAVVVEKVPERLAREITEEVAVPTIGIGASAACDGQVLVVDDMLGLFADFRPKFVRRYAELGTVAEEAVAAYAADVRSRAFPGPDHVYPDEPPAGAR